MDQVFPPLEQRNLHGLNETCGQRPVCIIIFQMLTEPFQLEDRDTPELDNFFPISTRWNDRKSKMVTGYLFVFFFIIFGYSAIIRVKFVWTKELGGQRKYDPQSNSDGPIYFKSMLSKI